MVGDRSIMDTLKPKKGMYSSLLALEEYTRGTEIVGYISGPKPFLSVLKIIIYILNLVFRLR